MIPYARNPLVSDDGTLYVYQDNRSLKVLDRVTGGIRTLTGVTYDVMSLSDDGNRIVFLSNAALTGTGTGTTLGFYVMNPRNPSAPVRLPYTYQNPVDQVSMTPRSLSGNGRYFTFTSPDQLAGATNGKHHAYIVDLDADPSTWTTTGVRLVSQSTAGAQGDGDSFQPTTNYSGSAVAFRTKSTNLVAGDTNAKIDAYAWYVDGTIKRVSLNGSGAQWATQDAVAVPGISDDGNRVAFRMSGNNVLLSKRVWSTFKSTDAFPQPGVITLTSTELSVAADGTRAYFSFGQRVATSSLNGTAEDISPKFPHYGSPGGTYAYVGPISRSGRWLAVSAFENTFWPKHYDAWLADLEPGTGGIAPPPSQTFGAGDPADTAVTNRSEGDPVNTWTGNWWISGTDAAMPSPGPAFSLDRTYNSADSRAGLFGAGWSSSYDEGARAIAGGVEVRTAGGARLEFSAGIGGTYTAAAGVLGKLTNRTGGGWSYTDTNHLRHQFDSTGRLVALIDRNGLSTTLTYTSGRLTLVTDPAGRVVTVTTDPATGVITAVALPDGRATTYGYTSGLLTSVTDPTAATTTYGYDSRGRLASVTDPAGVVQAATTYDGAGRVATQTDATGHVGTFTWNPVSKTSTYTDFRGGVHVDDYDTAGRLVSSSDATGATTTYTWTGASRRPATVTDPLGRVTSFTWDAGGRMLTSTDPAGHTQTFTYTAAGDPATVTDAGGAVTSYGYDTAGNVTSITAPQVGATPSVTTFARNSSGLPTTITDATGHVTTISYTGLLPATVTAPGGAVTSYGYDTTGRRTTIVDPRGNTAGADPDDYRWTTSYRADNQTATVTDPLGNTTTNTFDLTGRRTSSTGADGRTTTWAYDVSGRPTSVTAPGQGTTTWAYDDIAHTVTRTDANNHVTSTTFDAADRLVSATDAAGNTTGYTYDAASQLTDVTAPTGVTTAFSYDADGNRTAIDYSDATPDTTFSFDATGRLTGASNANTVYDFDFDAQGRLTAQTEGATTLTYTYDPAGRPLTCTQPDGTAIAYNYDTAGQASSLDIDGEMITLGRDAAGNVTSVTYPNGTVRATALDTAGRLTDSAWTGPDGAGATVTLASWNYTRDAVGRPSTVNRTLGAVTDTVSYGYDTAGRLTAECVGAPGSTCATATTVTTSTFDPVGNRTSTTDATGTTTSIFDAADRLTTMTDPSAVTTTRSYDAANRLTAVTDGSASTLGTWNAAGLLATLHAGADTTEFAYDPFGARVAATDTAGTIDSMWDHTTSATTPGLLGSDGIGYVSIDGTSPVAADVPNGSGGVDRQWFVTDPQGTPVAATDDAGALVAAPAQGDALGAGTQTVAGLGFLGLTGNPDGTTQLRARPYDTALGAFSAPDPLNNPTTGVTALGAPAVSTYLYGYGNPAVFTDPSGLTPTGPEVEEAIGRWVSDRASDVTGGASWVWKHTEVARDLYVDVETKALPYFETLANPMGARGRKEAENIINADNPGEYMATEAAQGMECIAGGLVGLEFGGIALGAAGSVLGPAGAGAGAAAGGAIGMVVGCAVASQVPLGPPGAPNPIDVVP